MTEPTFYWHDYETWGANPQLDRPAQFAGLRTTLDLEPVGRPQTFFAQPTPDFLPHPEAVLITGITPQHALNQGMNETSFAARIATEFAQPETTIVGYNNIAFDDEITRNLFYRNFIDPYEHTWQNNNSRWDLIDLMRACYALRPEGIEWPRHDDGRVSMKLEDLTRANGIDHGQAHDAMADVYATIEIARLVRKAQPKLFEYAYGLRRKQAVKSLIDLVKFQPLAHVCGFYGAQTGYLSVIVPLAFHPEQPNSLIYWDLRCDPEDFLELTPELLVERRFTRRAELVEQQLPFFGGQILQINRCPFVAKANVITADVAERWQLDLELMERRRHQLTGNPELRERIIQACLSSHDYPPESDPDLMLYSGDFFSDQDKSSMQIIRETAPEQLAGLDLNFSDPRLPEMVFRYRARNFPATLSDTELQKWQRFCQQRLTHPPGRALSADQFIQALQDASERHAANPAKLRLLNDLYRYVENL
ncbi:exodeoxyribonuclease I [Pseudidiomarina sp.]|uniref:exodeoxyribonuclease I n=1 Tax=Pseudidiomarina sp. TaxID=2081707 RepID=UPI00299D1671|nr:exodeoxyribonuclease I [Pseudidiomarina sp.]MDX1705528.1 exodeoxyribonuclease I [Pseudidiomarina sp.]